MRSPSRAVAGSVIIGPGSAIYGHWAMLSRGRSNVGSAQTNDLRAAGLTSVASSIRTDIGEAFIPSFYGGCRTYQCKLSDGSNELSIKRDRGNDRIELVEQIGLVFPQVLLRRFVLEKLRQIALCKH